VGSLHVKGSGIGGTEFVACKEACSALTIDIIFCLAVTFTMPVVPLVFAVYSFSSPSASDAAQRTCSPLLQFSEQQSDVSHAHCQQACGLTGSTSRVEDRQCAVCITYVRCSLF
jgi:hypothetical protein